MDKTDEQLVDYLHSQGFKVTPQRLAIIKYLKSQQTHPTAEEIYLAVKGQVPSIGQATVYKTLAMLTEIGFVLELNLGKQSRYDINIDAHVNIVCPTCGQVVDHMSEKVARLWKQVAEEIGGTIEGQRFDVYQVCSECASSEES